MQKLKLVLLCVFVAASIEVLNFGLHLMNLSSDLAYWGAVIGLVIWFVVFTPWAIRKLISKHKEKLNEEAKPVGNSAATDVDNRMHH